MSSYYTETPDLNPTGDLVQNARKNSSYKVLRLLLKLILWTLWAVIIIGGLSARSLGGKFVEMATRAERKAPSNSVYSVQEIGTPLEKEISILGIRATFSSSELESSFSKRYKDLSEKKERYMRTARDARDEKNETLMNEAAGLVNAVAGEIVNLTNANRILKFRISEIDAQRETNSLELQSRVQAGYVFMIILIVIILALLVYALYQAAIVVIDIADCQVEIFVKSEKGAKN